jgi:predicted acyltransferase (DUF342 family)
VTGALAFAGVLAGTVAWISVPLIPALRELLNPRDAGPLDAVGQDSGDLTFFADSFRQFVASGGFASAEAGTPLPDGREVMTLAAMNGNVDRKRTGLVVVPMGGALPAKSEYPVEVYSAGDMAIGEECTLRAVLAEGALTLAPNVAVLRWVHGERSLAAGDGSQLLGRATSRGVVALGRGVIFDRVLAPYIVVGEATAAPTTLTRDAWELQDSRPQFTLARASAVLASQHWLVDENLVIPDGQVFRGNLVVRGSLRIGKDCEIRGSVKAHKTLTVGSGAVITGTAAGREDIVLKDGSRVYGPVISEGMVTLLAKARVGLPNMPASVSAERIELHQGAEVFGSLSARLEGVTVA